MKVTLKTLGLGLGAAVLAASPLAAMPQYCPNAKPGCAGTCHTDANLAKCPPKSAGQPSIPGQKPPSSSTGQKPPSSSTGQKPPLKLLEGVAGF